ncbi:MAG: hypothetical protein D6739_10665, partial [Nitrospirae bacterium]
LLILAHLFRWHRPGALALLALPLAGHARLHRLTLRPFLRTLRYLRALLAVTVGLNLALTPGHVVWGAAPLHLWVTREGIALAALTGLRLVGAVWIAHALYRSVEPEALVAAAARLAGPLAAPGRRLHHAAVVAQLAMGFLPWFADHLGRWRREPGELEGRLVRLLHAGEEEIAARAAAAEAGRLADPWAAGRRLRFTAADLAAALLLGLALAAGWAVEAGLA